MILNDIYYSRRIFLRGFEVRNTLGETIGLLKNGGLIIDRGDNYHVKKILDLILTLYNY